MKRGRYSFLEELAQEKRQARKRIREIDARLSELHPAWCEMWRLKKQKDRLERKLRHL